LILILHTCTSVEDGPPVRAQRSSACISSNCWRICCISAAIGSRLTCTTDQLNDYSTVKRALLLVTHKLLHSKCSWWQNPMRNVKSRRWHCTDYMALSHNWRTNQYDLSTTTLVETIAPVFIMSCTLMTTIDTRQGVHIDMVRFITHHWLVLDVTGSVGIFQGIQGLFSVWICWTHTSCMRKWRQLVEEHETKVSVVKKAEASLYFKGSLQVTHQS
jgi:hypothetical protein